VRGVRQELTGALEVVGLSRYHGDPSLSPPSRPSVLLRSSFLAADDAIERAACSILTGSRQRRDRRIRLGEEREERIRKRFQADGDGSG
jgi:hypothetical protein